MRVHLTADDRVQIKSRLKNKKANKSGIAKRFMLGRKPGAHGVITSHICSEHYFVRHDGSKNETFYLVDEIRKVRISEKHLADIEDLKKESGRLLSLLQSYLPKADWWNESFIVSLKALHKLISKALKK